MCPGVRPPAAARRNRGSASGRGEGLRWKLFAASPLFLEPRTRFGEADRELVDHIRHQAVRLWTHSLGSSTNPACTLSQRARRPASSSSANSDLSVGDSVCAVLASVIPAGASVPAIADSDRGVDGSECAADGGVWFVTASVATANGSPAETVDLVCAVEGCRQPWTTLRAPPDARSSLQRARPPPAKAWPRYFDRGLSCGCLL